MSREIKFRAWDKKKKQFYMKSAISVSNDGVLRHLRGFDQWADTSFIPLQYTGLKDKNGKEIYEGDIVRHLDTQGFEKLAIGVIKYNNLRAQFEHSRYSEECLQGNVLEIIGNIYENPELLEVNNELK